MSGELVDLLRRRAMAFLRAAERLLEEREHDVSCFCAEQALQLYAKSVLLRIAGEHPRTHSVGEILGRIVLKLRELGLDECSKELSDVVRELRDVLIVLEDVYAQSRYGVQTFSEEDARRILSAVKTLIDALRRADECAWGQSSVHGSPRDPLGLRLSYLRGWRKYLEILVRAASDVCSGCEVYVFGGAAEDRLTALSDIDVLIVTSEGLDRERSAKIRGEILWRAFDYGLPLDYPVEIHLVTRRELERYIKRARRMLRAHLCGDGLCLEEVKLKD